jgi:hypothetical protein
MVCPHLRACFACDGISCSSCGVVRSVAVESDGSLFEWLFQLHPQPQTIYLDFDGTLCNTASGGAPQVGKHSLHGELAAIVDSGAFQVVIVTKQNPQHHLKIVAFLEALGWKEGQEYILHCIGGTGVSKSSIIQACMGQQSSSVFVDDSIKEILQARSALPLSVTMLVFAASKSSYLRSLKMEHVFAASMPMSSETSAVHPEGIHHTGIALSTALQTASKLENVLGVKVDLSSPAPSRMHFAPTGLLSAPMSAAPATVKDGPGWTAASETPPICGTSTSKQSGAGNFLLKISFLRLIPN